MGKEGEGKGRNSKDLMKYTTTLTREKKGRDGWTGELQEEKAKEDSGVKNDDTSACGSGDGGVVVVVVVVDVDLCRLVAKATMRPCLVE